MNNIVNFKVVKFNNGCFISDSLSYGSNIPNLLFDEKKAIPSLKQYWYKLENVPTKITKLGNKQYINHRYELKKNVKWDLPKSYKREEFVYKDQNYNWTPLKEFEDIFSLYKEVSDEIEPEQEEVPFELSIIFDIDLELFDPKDISKFKYFYFIPGSYGKSINQINSNSVQYQLLNELMVPDLFIDQTPCSLTCQQSYDIIRYYLRQNINPVWATITDYDFCLTVEKNIKIENIHIHEVIEDVINKKKPKVINKYRDSRKINILKICPKAYEKYDLVTPFKGNNLQDLKDNIDKYLSELIKEINEPLVNCPHCKGLGVINYQE